MSPRIHQELHGFLGAQTEAMQFSGVALIARGDEILHEQGYGFADHTTQRSNDPSLLYKIGSMTKAFVSLSILMLEERGLLSVEHKVEQYLPEFSIGSALTLHQLMSQSSGVWCYLQDPTSPFWPVMERPHRPEELLEYMRNRPLDFAPGSHYKYSNSGYVLLGMIIERVAGCLLGEFLRREIFDPLGLKHTIFDPTEREHRDRVAIGYDHLGDTPSIARNLHASVTYASGAIVSTVGDLYLWDQSLYESPLVQKTALQRMFTPGLGNYGYGWWIDTLPIHGHPCKNIWHWGCSSGYHGIITRLVEEGVTIILLQNWTSPDLQVPEAPESLLRLRDQIVSIVFTGDKHGRP